MFLRTNLIRAHLRWRVVEGVERDLPHRFALPNARFTTQIS